jgi:anti-sigma factor ChrR (cupin superfamily)
VPVATLAIRSRPGGIYAHDTLDLPWVSAGCPGLHLKSVRASREAGQFLGLIGFDPMTRSGLHQHQAPAFSYLLDGSLHDHDGEARQGDMGINLAGATHDATAYNRCVLASRLEGPVTYPPEEGGAEGRVHTGARDAAAGGFRNPAPEVPPDLNIALADLRPFATGIGRLTRRLVFDHRVIGEDRRLVVLNLLPGTTIPAHRLRASVEWFVLGGEARIGPSVRARGGSFVILEPGAEAEISSEFGARLIAWADGPVDWLDGVARPDPYGF